MLGQQGRFPQSGAACEQAEAEAVRLANEMRAEYWSVSAKTGEWVRGCRRGRRSGAGPGPWVGGLRPLLLRVGAGPRGPGRSLREAGAAAASSRPLPEAGVARTVSTNRG